MVVAADFDEDGIIDLAVTNYDSADVSVLLGLGDGSFAPQRRFDATFAPFGMTVGDVNDDGHMDLIVVDSPFAVVSSTLAVLLGRGDGSFQPQRLTDLRRIYSVATPTLAFLEGDDKPVDLILGGGSGDGFDIFKSDGNGGFLPTGHFAGTRQSPDAVIADVNGDGKLDILAAALSVDGNIWLLPGNGHGTFQEPVSFFAGQSSISLALIDWGTAEPDGSFTAGVPDGLLDVVVANAGTTQGVAAIVGPPEIVVLPNLGFDGTNFLGYGGPVRVSLAEQPLALKISDFNGDGVKDIGVVDRREFFVIYGSPPTIGSNSTRESARDLGPLVHVVEPTLTITPHNSESWYSLTVPTESFDTTRKQVLDFSGGFANQAGGGLVMEVTDRDGNLLGRGERFRVLAHQGDLLYVHIFGKPAEQGNSGSGAYTLVIDTLPRLVEVEPLTLLPGGPTTSLELVFQGERLNAATAEVPANYQVIWLGSNGVEGGGDDQEIPVGIDLPAGSRPVIYNPGSNVDVASGLVHPTSVRQTVTLLFAHPLLPGTYKVVVKKNVLSAEFNSDETAMITPSAGLNGHPVVSTNGADIQEGAQLLATDLVKPVGQLGNLAVFEQGTPFLSQLYYDLGALLDALLSGSGDDGSITNQLIQQVVGAIGAALGPSGPTIAVVFLDPPSSDVIDPAGLSAKNDLQADSFTSNLQRAFVGVGSNVDLFVFASPNGEYHLNLSDVPPLSRGGVVYFGNQGIVLQSLTHDIQSGKRSFTFDFGDSSASIALLQSFLGTSQTIASQFVTTPQRLDPTNGRDGFQSLFVQALSALGTSSAASTTTRAGGGSARRQWLEAVERAWTDFDGWWGTFGEEFLDDSTSKDSDTTSGAPGHASELRIWSGLMNVWEDLLGSDGSKSPSPAEHAHRERRQAKPSGKSSSDESDQGNVGSAADGQAPAGDQNSAASASEDGSARESAANSTSNQEGSGSASASDNAMQGSDPHAAPA